MSEAKWLAEANPSRLLEMVRTSIHARKLRLFAVACCRRIDHLLTDPRTREIVDFSERLADDRNLWAESAAPLIARAREVIQERFGLHRSFRGDLDGSLTGDGEACVVVCFLLWRMEVEAFQDTSRLLRYAASRFPAQDEAIHQCNLLRCVVGNPYRPVSVERSWLTSTVLPLARGIYEEKAFDRLPILADALEDAGCDNEDVLNHLRGPGPHCRGCWVVDQLLGKG